MKEDDFISTIKGQTCSIIGLGLMGGSLAAALHGMFHTIIGYDLRPEYVKIAVEKNYIDKGTSHLSEAIKEANIIVLATPMRVILNMIDEISSILPNKSIVMDLGSVKVPVVEKMQSLPDEIQIIGGHPMCGREKSGIEAVDPHLFKNAPFILTPAARTSRNTIDLLSFLIQSIGARPLILEAERHDLLVAAISHLPYLIACNLVRSAEIIALNDAELWDVASSGFRDTTRLAASNVEMSLDILLTNKDRILDMTRMFQEQLASFISLLENNDEDMLRDYLSSVQNIRKHLFVSSPT